MACNCILTSSFLPSLPFYNHPQIRLIRHSLNVRPAITCNLDSSKTDEEESRSKNDKFNLLKLSVTLTVVSAALPQPSIAAKVSKRSKKTKTIEALTPQELKKWSQGLPVVANRIPYTEILNLKQEGKLKHIIKSPNVGLKQRPEVVLAVLDNSRVLRIVLPSIETDQKFWASWDELNINSLCVNAFSPPLKKPEIPSPYLGFLSKVPQWMFSFVKPKPQSKKALELKRVREELKRQRDEEIKRMNEEKEMMERAMKMQKKMEDRNRKRKQQKIKYEESLSQARKDFQHMAGVWENLAIDLNVSTALGFLFFYIFYRTVVLNYRRKKKDYEDRLKIEKAGGRGKEKNEGT